MRYQEMKRNNMRTMRQDRKAMHKSSRNSFIDFGQEWILTNIHLSAGSQPNGIAFVHRRIVKLLFLQLNLPMTIRGRRRSRVTIAVAVSFCYPDGFSDLRAWFHRKQSRFFVGIDIRPYGRCDAAAFSSSLDHFQSSCVANF